MPLFSSWRELPLLRLQPVAQWSAGRLCPIVPHEYCARHEGGYVARSVSLAHLNLAKPPTAVCGDGDGQSSAGTLDRWLGLRGGIMKKLVSIIALAAAATACQSPAGTAGDQTPTASATPAAAAPYKAPRGPDGQHPDLNGVWQVLNTANYNIEAHPAQAALQLRPGPYVPVPGRRSRGARRDRRRPGRHRHRAG